MNRSSFICIFLLLLPGLTADGATLEEKLQAQWARYEAARALLIQHVRNTSLPPEERLVMREEWERTLTLTGELAFDSEDVAALRHSQRQRSERARRIAAWKSFIDLDAIRATPNPEDRRRDIAAFCAGLPKGGMLHVHPGGTLSRETVQKLLSSRNPNLSFQGVLTSIAASNGGAMLYPYEIAWLKGMGPDQLFLDLPAADQERYQDFLFLPRGKQPFARFNGVFAFLGSVIPEDAAYEEALLAFARRAVAAGVSYVEFTSGVYPEYFPILQRIENETGLVIRVNRSFNRTLPVAELQTQLQDLLAAPSNNWIVGIDFLDDETDNSALDKGQLLYGTVLDAVHTGQTTFRRTMHAGELGDLRNPRDAMIMGAERLGHGVNLHADPVTLEYAARQHVAVEVNLSSNLRLTGVRRIKDHPFLTYLRLGLPVSLSTDDEGIFDTDINRECRLAVSETDVTYEELKQMAFNSIATSFATDLDKERLKKRLETAFSKFEMKYRKLPQRRSRA